SSGGTGPPSNTASQRYGSFFRVTHRKTLAIIPATTNRTSIPNPIRNVTVLSWSLLGLSGLRVDALGLMNGWVSLPSVSSLTSNWGGCCIIEVINGFLESENILFKLLSINTFISSLLLHQ
ncbi:hypothetical protein C0J52_19610, partial [Blattella germanica]